ncbi:MAG: glycosyltransferase family 9 protein [bacterium]|nr:glycosyltransferase family 9 protein [bacterium]
MAEGTSVETQSTNTWLSVLFGLVVHRRPWEPRRRYDPESVKKILLVRNDNIGDVICSTPAIEAVRRAFPQAYVAILVAGYSLEAIESNPHVDEIYVYEKARHHPEVPKPVSLWRQWKVLQAIRAQGFDLAIGLRAYFSPSQGWLVYASGAPFRLGNAPHAPKHGKFAFYYNLALETDWTMRHEVERTLDVVRAIGLDNQQKNLTFVVPEADRETVAAFLDEQAEADKPLVGINTFSRIVANRWPPERFAELADRLVERYGVQVVFTSQLGEEWRVGEVQRAMSHPSLTYSASTIKRFAALQAACSLFVTTDGGPVHTSAAVGTPTVAIFGITDNNCWYPWGQGHVALKRGQEATNTTVEDVLHALEGMDVPFVRGAYRASSRSPNEEP